MPSLSETAYPYRVTNKIVILSAIFLSVQTAFLYQEAKASPQMAQMLLASDDQLVNAIDANADEIDLKISKFETESKQSPASQYQGKFDRAAQKLEKFLNKKIDEASEAQIADAYELHPSANSLSQINYRETLKSSGKFQERCRVTPYATSFLKFSANEDLSS